MSHVRPARVVESEQAKVEQETHLVNYAKPVEDCIQHLAKATSAVRAIHLGESKQSVLKGPFSRCMLLDPMSCDSKISICIISLPGIAGQTDFPHNSGALNVLMSV